MYHWIGHSVVTILLSAAVCYASIFGKYRTAGIRNYHYVGSYVVAFGHRQQNVCTTIRFVLVTMLSYEEIIGCQLV